MLDFLSSVQPTLAGNCKLNIVTVPLSTKPEKVTIANPATVKCFLVPNVFVGNAVKDALRPAMRSIAEDISNLKIKDNAPI